MSEKIPKQGTDSKQGDEVLFTRHSKAKYQQYSNIVAGETPEQSMDYENQPESDLPEAGVELAKEKADELFSKMDPGKDVLFFATSPERRAIDTANIYRLSAKEQGFEVICPDNVRSNLVEEIGEGEIRKIEELSTKIDNVLVSTVFNPGDRHSAVNWGAVDEVTKKKLAQATAIIVANDKGSWGANFAEHSEAIAALFPEELRSARELYERQFKNIIRLARFGMRKAQECDLEKNVKILAFGHESYFTHALNMFFGEHDLKNCETISILVDNDDTRIEFRDQQSQPIK